jgi:hypothetical protein
MLPFLDADCLPRRHWLDSALHLIGEHGEAVFGSDYLILPESGWAARAGC